MHRSPILTAAGFTLAALVPTLALGGGGAIDLPDPGFAPEGISASADGTLYAGSITQGRIVAIFSSCFSIGLQLVLCLIWATSHAMSANAWTFENYLFGSLFILLFRVVEDVK